MHHFPIIRALLKRLIAVRSDNRFININWGIAALSFALVAPLQFARADVALVPTKVEKTVMAYANSIGCNANFDKKNVAKLPANFGLDRDGYIIVFYVDVGCEGGTTSEQSVFAILIQNDRGQTYIAPQYSTPDSTIGFPKNITSVYIKGGFLWYTAKDYDLSKDALCCPSVAVVGKLSLKKISSPVGNDVIDTWYWVDSDKK